MFDEEMRRLDESHQHGPILEILVRNVCLGDPNVQAIVDDLAQQAPSIAIFLCLVSVGHYLSKPFN